MISLRILGHIIWLGNGHVGYWLDWMIKCITKRYNYQISVAWPIDLKCGIAALNWMQVNCKKGFLPIDGAKPWTENRIRRTKGIKKIFINIPVSVKFISISVKHQIPL